MARATKSKVKGGKATRRRHTEEFKREATRMADCGRFPPHALQHYGALPPGATERRKTTLFGHLSLRCECLLLGVPTAVVASEGRPSAWEAMRLPPAICGLPKGSSRALDGGTIPAPENPVSLCLRLRHRSLHCCGASTMNGG